MLDSIQSWPILAPARGRWLAGPRGSCLKRQGARSKVSKQRSDLSLLRPWTSNMAGRYWFHQRLRTPHPAVRDTHFQDSLLAALARFTAAPLN